VTLQSLDPLYIQFNLPEQLFKQLHINQQIQVNVEEFPNVLFEGKITAINSKIDTNTHNILVQATMPNCPAEAMTNPDKSPLIKIHKEQGETKQIITCNSELNQKNKVKKFLFIPGMFASISIEQPVIPNVIVLPSTAISYSLYGNSVFVIENSGKKNNEGKELLYVKRVFVNTGEQEGNDTIILKGINAGQWVVSSGELKLQNGASVVINNSIMLNKSSDINTLGQ
jgi:membrane fusion protein (multidrug efflux system)